MAKLNRLAALAGLESAAEPAAELVVPVPGYAQPRWVPDWAWSQRNEPGSLDSIDEMHLARTAEVADEILQADAEVWPALERHATRSLEIWRERLTEALGSSWRERAASAGIDFESISEVSQGDVLWEMSFFAARSLDSFDGHRRYTARERKKAANKAMKAINHLVDLLDVMDESGAGLPFQISRQIRSADGVKGELYSLACGVSEWADSAPAVARPNAPDAPRLYFIRDMTRWARYRFGTPLRGPVLNLTSVFFDIDQLTESTIAQLAP